MILPKQETIFRVNEIVNRLMGDKTVTFKPHIRRDYCSLVPNTDAELPLINVVSSIRKEFKKLLYVWVDVRVDQGKEISILNFFQKQL